jgi:endonuclease/exonuclease/phosphatase family metal-dependent hydrolase
MKRSIFLFSILIFIFSCDTGTTEDKNPVNSTAEELVLASWNIRILSDASRDDSELQKIAAIINRYDFVAIQEVRDTIVLSRLKALLPGWDYIVSDAVGNTVTERYAYFYRTDLVSPLGTPYIYNDPNNEFIREPYVAHFRSGEFDFTVITIHIIYGDTVADRRAEVSLLDEVIANVDTANGAEQDVMLMGDFNLPPDDSAWGITNYANLVPATTMTTITDTSSYDNFWIDILDTTECDDSILVYRFDDGFIDDDTASLEVSDHRPISTVFDITADDDGDGDWNTVTGDTSDGSATATDGDIQILSVIADPTESEAVTIKNYSTWDVDLSAWTIGDLNNQDSYSIPDGTIISAGGSITYDSQLNFGINNTGETIYLKNNGVLKDTWSN